MLDYYYRRKDEALAYLGGRCVNCGEVENLEFDHIDPHLKEFTITKLFSVSNTRFWNEIEKCQLLCAECHELKTSDDRGVAHGGGVSGKKNCPCDLCRARKSEYSRAYNLTHVRKRDR
jgi:hypothetical protein